MEIQGCVPYLPVNPVEGLNGQWSNQGYQINYVEKQGNTPRNYIRIKQVSRAAVLFNSEFSILLEIFNHVISQHPVVNLDSTRDRKDTILNPNTIPQILLIIPRIR